MFFTFVFSWCSFSRCWSISGNSSMLCEIEGQFRNLVVISPYTVRSQVIGTAILTRHFQCNASNTSPDLIPGCSELSALVPVVPHTSSSIVSWPVLSKQPWPYDLYDLLSSPEPKP